MVIEVIFAWAIALSVAALIVPPLSNLNHD